MSVAKDATELLRPTAETPPAAAVEVDGAPLATLLLLDGADAGTVLARASGEVATLVGDPRAAVTLDGAVTRLVLPDGCDPPAPVRATAEAVARLAGLLLECARHRAASAAHRAPQAGPRKRVLLVEDEPNHAELVATMLTRRGYAVEVAADGAEGIRRAEAAPPDLILLDVRMPSLDGFTAAAELRRDERTRDVPILFLSACDEVGAKVRGLELGAVDYLAKPFHGAELLARLDRAFAEGEARAELRQAALVDHLTGLGNLRFLEERLRQECARAERYQVPLAVAMLDLDGLKRVNDSLGHAAGNAVLARVGRVLRDESRDSDAAARFGGDEFVVVLPHTELADARAFAERVRRRLRDGESGTPATVSIGVAAYAPRGAEGGAERLLALADAAVYRAKRDGGDRVCTLDGAGDSGPGESDG